MVYVDVHLTERSLEYLEVNSWFQNILQNQCIKFVRDVFFFLKEERWQDNIPKNIGESALIPPINCFINFK